MRALYYVPILHVDSELGEIGPIIQDLRARMYGQEAVKRDEEAIKSLWEQTRIWILTVITDFQGLIIYQDAMPAGPREKIRQLFDLALADHSDIPLFLLTKELLDKGAILEGAENIDLLVKRSAVYKQIYRLAVGCQNLKEARERIVAKVQEEDALVEQADKFIAQRIDQTLPENGQGIIFMGLQHKVDEELVARQQAGQLSSPIQIRKLEVILEAP